MVEKGEIRPIEEIHHVVPRSHWGRGNHDKHDIKNLVGLCNECHTRHQPHVQAWEMIVYILGQLHDLYGYEYTEEHYSEWARAMYAERTSTPQNTGIGPGLETQSNTG